jgi:hypothetical protein
LAFFARALNIISRVLVPTLKVGLGQDTVVVFGIIHSPREEKLLKEITQEVCRDQPVRFNLHRRG